MRSASSSTNSSPFSPPPSLSPIPPLSNGSSPLLRTSATTTKRRRRVSKSEFVARSRTSLERLFGKHRGVALRLFFSLPFVMLGICALLCFLFTRVCIRTLSWMWLDSDVRTLRHKLHRATSIQEYEAIARQLDTATGCEAWKHEIRSNAYDWRRVILWTKALRTYTMLGKIHRICDVLSTAQHLKFGRVFSEDMFSYCHWGTKVAVEDFFRAVQDALIALIHHVSSPAFQQVPCVEVLRFVREFAAGWGQTALYLSGGGMIGFHHFGVGKALLQLDLVPDVLVGCSAGSAVAAWLATRSGPDAERELENDLFAKVFAPFESTSLRHKIANLLFMGHLCTKEGWLQCARRIYADLSFREAYELTGRTLNISTCRADEGKGYDASYLLNYRSAPNVLLTSAILASSAFPLLAAPFTLAEKLPNGDICPSTRFGTMPFRDGSLIADIPVSTITREYGVGFSIVAQVNPHVYPFLGLQGRARAGRPARKRIVRHGAALLSVLGRMEEFFREVMASILRLGLSLDVWPSIRGMDTGRFLNQTYKGDVTLLPRRIFWSHRFAASNITREKDVSWYLNEGQIMAFEKTPLIRARLEIERLVTRLRDECPQVSPSEPKVGYYSVSPRESSASYLRASEFPNRCCSSSGDKQGTTLDEENFPFHRRRSFVRTPPVSTTSTAPGNA